MCRSASFYSSLWIIPLARLWWDGHGRIRFVMRNPSSQICFLLCVIFAFYSPAIAQRDDSLSLEDALRGAFAVDENIKAVEANVQASRAGIRQAKAAYFPDLAFATSYYHLTNVNAFTFSIPGTGISRTFQLSADNPFQAQLGLNYDLLTFGRRPATVSIARFESTRSQFDQVHSKKTLFDAVARAYFALAYATESLRLAEAQTERFEQIYKLTRNRYEQQLVPEFDLLRTELRLEQHRLSVLEMSNGVAIARLDLGNLMGLAGDRVPAPRQGLDSESLVRAQLIEADTLLKNREDYQVATLAVESIRQTQRLQKSAYFPTLSAFATYDWRNGYQPDVEKIEGNFSIGGRLSWLLFDGFARPAGVAKQNYFLMASRYQVENLRRDIPKQVKSTELLLENNRIRIVTAEKALDVARKAMAIARTRYEIGDLTMIDLLETENHLAEAELEVVRLKYQHVLAQLDYKRVCGYYPELEQLGF